MPPGRRGILRRRDDGNRTYYSAETEGPIFGDLHGLLLRTAGLRDVLAESLEPLRDRIDVAFVYGSVARTDEHATSDIDLMVIGRIGLSELAPALKDAEGQLLRPVNPSVYTATRLRRSLPRDIISSGRSWPERSSLSQGIEMTWQRLSNAKHVQTHATTKRELDDLLAVIDRDLQDAGVPGLSADRSFATSYNAALQTAKMAIACAGYRVIAKKGHHQVSFEGAELAVGPSTSKLAAYFETCRRKRNTLDYDVANVVSDTEAVELLQKAQEFRQEVETWIAKNHPQFVP